MLNVKTETGLTWDIATSVRKVLTKEGKVTIATGHGDTYKELETPTNVHGLVGACFSGMWHEPALAKHFPTYVEFNLVATTISTVYNEAAKNAGLLSRMCKLLPTARGEAPPKKMRVYHSKGDKDDKAPQMKTSSGAAASSTASASSSSQRPQQQPDEDQEAKDTVNRLGLHLIQTNQLGTGTGVGNPGAGRVMDTTPSHGRDSTGNREASDLPVKTRLACALGQHGFRLVFPLRNQQPGTALLRLQCGTA